MDEMIFKMQKEILIVGGQRNADTESTYYHTRI